MYKNIPARWQKTQIKMRMTLFKYAPRIRFALAEFEAFFQPEKIT